MMPMLDVAHWFCFNSMRTPPLLAGCTNAISDPSAPGRGSSSIIRTPRALSCATAARMSGTRKRDVVQAGAAFVDVLRDRRFGRGRLEQLEPRLADRREVRAHLLRGDILGRFDLEAERIAVERERRLEILHGDANVIQNGFHTDKSSSSSFVSSWQMMLLIARLPGFTGA